VDCTFVLHNTGKATRVLIGFPESGGGDIVVPKMGFEYFRSYVDGKRVQVRVQEQRRESGPGGYFRWYLKRVRFGAGQTRVIRNVYRAPLGAISTGHDFFFFKEPVEQSPRVGHPVPAKTVGVQRIASEEVEMLDSLSGRSL
jgi:hypothetical protein